MTGDYPIYDYSRSPAGAISCILRRRRGRVVPGPNKFFDIKTVYNKHDDTECIIVVSLFGDGSPRIKNRYITPFIQRIRSNKLPQKWYVRVYLDPRLTTMTLKKFLELDCEVYIMRHASVGLTGALWKFLAAAETIPFVCEDADDYLSQYALRRPYIKHVQTWLKTDTPFLEQTVFTIPFPLSYQHFIPMNAGKWGAKPAKDGKPPVPNIKELMEKYNFTWYGADEAFLAKEVFPIAQKKGIYRTGNPFDAVALVLLLLIIGYIIYRVIKKA